MDGAAPSSELLVLDRTPKARKDPQPELEDHFAIVQRFVAAVRQLRAVSTIKDNLKITVQVKPIHPKTASMLERRKPPACFLAKPEGLEFASARQKGMAASYDPAFELYIDLSKYLDLAVELKRLDKDLAGAEKEVESHRTALANPNFVDRAPADKVAEKK